MDVSSVCPSVYYLLGGTGRPGDMSLHLSLSEKGKRETGRRRLFASGRLPRDEKKDMLCTDDSISGQVKCCESVFHGRARSRRLQMPNGKKSGTSGA